MLNSKLMTRHTRINKQLNMTVKIISSCSRYWMLCFQMWYCKLVCFVLELSPK